MTRKQVLTTNTVLVLGLLAFAGVASSVAAADGGKAVAAPRGFGSINKCKIAGCVKCRRKKCKKCLSGMAVTAEGACTPAAACVPGTNGCVGSDSGPNNAYAINFDKGYASVSCYDFVPGDAGRGKCGNFLAYGDVSPGAKINFWAAIPLAYWPTTAAGNCNDCGVKCSTYWSADATVVDASGPMCYRIRNKSNTGPTYTIRIGDSCGGNCPDPPGDNQAAATPHPACEQGTAGFDCARWAAAYAANPSLPNVAYLDGGAYRCPNNQECRSATWYDNFYPAGSAADCPSDMLWTDFCGGKYMHFDLMTQLSAAASCNLKPNPIYDLCPGGGQGSGHCVVAYERIKCPS